MKLKQSLPLLFIAVIALILRLIWLDKVPTGITGDELDYVLNAKAVFLTGKDITGTWSPFSLTTPPNEFPKAELPYLIMAPFIGISNFSLFAARLPYALISVLLVLIMYLISYKLFGKNIALLTGFVMAINPWSVYFGRTAYDTQLAVFFYFLALYILLIAKKWHILLAFPILFLAFFSYIGTKILLIPFVVIVTFYVWHKNKKRYLKQYTTLFLLCVGLVFFFIFSLQNRALLRTGDFLSPNNSKIINTVDTERRLSIKTPIRQLMSNKAVVFGKESINTYLGAFSPGLLFLYAESSPFISLWYHGLFYYIDFLFILLGLVYLFKENRSLWVFLISLIFIAPLPAVASSVGLSYSIRSSLLFPLLTLFISLGIWYIFSLKKGGLYKVLITGLLIISYVILLTNFMYIYLFRHPIFDSDSSGLSGRILSRYIQLAKNKNREITVIEGTSLGRSSTFKQHLFYTNGYNKFTKEKIRRSIINDSSSYDNLKIALCPNEPFSKEATVVSPSGTNCLTLPKGDNLLIAKLSDGGGIYSIYNDTICRKYKLSRYPQNITLEDFEIENLSEKKFCEKFITDLNPK